MATTVPSFLPAGFLTSGGPSLLPELGVLSPGEGLVGTTPESLRLALQEPRFRGQAAVINAYLESRRGCPSLVGPTDPGQAALIQLNTVGELEVDEKLAHLALGAVWLATTPLDPDESTEQISFGWMARLPHELGLSTANIDGAGSYPAVPEDVIGLGALLDRVFKPLAGLTERQGVPHRTHVTKTDRGRARDLLKEIFGYEADFPAWLKWESDADFTGVGLSRRRWGQPVDGGHQWRSRALLLLPGARISVRFHGGEVVQKRSVMLAGSTGKGLFADANEWGHGTEFFRPPVRALEFVNTGDKTAIELVAVKVRRGS